MVEFSTHVDRFESRLAGTLHKNGKNIVVIDSFPKVEGVGLVGDHQFEQHERIVGGIVVARDITVLHVLFAALCTIMMNTYKA